MKSLFTFAFVVFSFYLSACDICNFYAGSSPNDFRNTFGIIYRSRFLHGTIYPDGTVRLKHSSNIGTNDTITGKEIFNVAELRFRYFVGQRWNFIASLPLVNNYQSENGYTVTDIYGMGDPTLLANYLVAGTKKEEGYNHRLTFGLGVKLPAGMKHRSYNGKEAELDFQPSTGSWDALMRLEYLLIAKNFVLNNSFSFRLNSEGTNQHRYGNTLNYTLNAAYLHKFNLKSTLAPNLGCVMESAGFDKVDGVKKEDSGGRVWFLHAGLDWYKGRTALQFAFEPTTANQFNGAQFPVKNRFIVGLVVNL